MYSIEYVIGTTRHIVYSPFDNTRKIVSGTYHRETNTIGSLTFSFCVGSFFRPPFFAAFFAALIPETLFIPFFVKISKHF